VQRATLIALMLWGALSRSVVAEDSSEPLVFDVQPSAIQWPDEVKLPNVRMFPRRADLRWLYAG